MNNYISNVFLNYLELKYRCLYYFFSFIFVFIVLFLYKVELFFFISEFFLSLKKQFIYTSLIEPLLVYFKLAFFYSIFLTIPSCIYLYFFFFIKSVYNSYIYLYGLFFILLFVLASMLYYLIVKVFFVFFFEYLLTYQRIEIVSIFQLYLEATINQYLSIYFFLFYLYFLLILMIPLVFVVLLVLRILNNNFFYRKYFYLLVLFCFILLAPPDFYIQILILPFICLFLELYIYFSIFFFKIIC